MVINTKDVVFTGKKWNQKLYRHHTGLVSQGGMCLHGYHCDVHLACQITNIIITLIMQISRRLQGDSG